MEGKVFGRWTVIEFSHKDSQSRRVWLCECECGSIKAVLEYNLKSGRSTSCGCYHKETISKIISDRNYVHGEAGTRLYKIWQNMKQRCANPKDTHYKWYGGRGIKVCDAWQEYIPFRDWALQNGYDDSLTIERIDSSKGYEPNNCEWVSLSENVKRRWLI